MKKLFLVVLAAIVATVAVAQTPSANTVNVVYSGTTATVAVASNIAQYLTVAQSGAHVSITQSSDVATEITYNLSGTSADGEFYMAGSFKATIELNGLDLTNATPVYSGAAVHIQNSKRINIKVITGTTNSLADAASGSQKGCLYVKGHAEFKQQGTLNVVGNVKHAIKAGEYISLKNATLNITSAVGDGISCNQYFLMESGNVNIRGTADDGIQCDLDGDTSTGELTDHEDEDSGNIYIEGGNITINCTALAAKGMKSAGDINIAGTPVINITTSGNGTWDTDDLETKAACGMSADGNLTIGGGTLTLTATGSGGKGMKCDSALTIAGGTITVTTSGGLYYNNGTTENTNYTGNTDNLNSNYYSSPKGIKAGLKVQSGNSYAYSGGVVIRGGNTKVTTSGRNGEGIESKNTFNIAGGQVFVNAYDDALNSAQDFTIDGGYVYARATNNDGMDANGNFYINGGLVYAIGASSPEVAIDANSEDHKQLYITGGVVIALGGIENGSSVSQPYRSTSVSGNVWYTVSYGNDSIAFLTPTSSNSGSGGGPGGGGHGGGPGGGSGGSGSSSSTAVISAPSSPTVATGNSIANGSSLFEGNCYVSGTISTGTSYTVSECSSYTWNGTTYTTSGTYYYGDDTLNLTIFTVVNVSTRISAENSYTWNGTTYTTSGTYTYSFADANGCTEVDTLHLTITAGIGNAEANTINVRSEHGQIVVEGAQQQTISLYDMTGKLLATKTDYSNLVNFDVPTSGCYIVKTEGNYACKVVVVK